MMFYVLTTGSLGQQGFSIIAVYTIWGDYRASFIIITKDQTQSSGVCYWNPEWEPMKDDDNHRGMFILCREEPRQRQANRFSLSWSSKTSLPKRVFCNMIGNNVSGTEKQLCWNQICQMIALHYTTCQGWKDELTLSPNYWAVIHIRSIQPFGMTSFNYASPRRHQRLFVLCRTRHSLSLFDFWKVFQK